VGAATVLQRDDRLGRVFATSPTLFSAPVRSTLSLEKQREEFTGNLVTDTTRISWEQRSRVFGRVELSYAYKFERLHTFRPPDPNFPTFDVSLRVARLTGNISWDTRDDPSNSTRGSWLTSSIEDAPAALLSQIRYVRYLGRAYHFQPVGKIVLASAFQYGVITPLGGQEVIPSKLFLTGGSTSIRGLAEDGAGPRDAFGPLGGRALMLINQEVRFPMYKWFGGVGFVDAGNVFTTPRDVSFGDLATSIGVGLRISPPKIPIIRIDYGHLVQGWAPGDARSRWVFAIGQAF
jgi:outer membrane protein assembly factor BamA